MGLFGRGSDPKGCIQSVHIQHLLYRRCFTGIIWNLLGAVLLCTIMASTLGAVASASSNTMAPRVKPTSADFRDAGPEAREHHYGLIRPSHFLIGDVPVSYDANTSNTHWNGWGDGRAVGRGRILFCVIMSPCHKTHFRIVLMAREPVVCHGYVTHFSYKRFRLHVPTVLGKRPIVNGMRVGCSR
jgi:hypothetical protein